MFKKPDANDNIELTVDVSIENLNVGNPANTEGNIL